MAIMPPSSRKRNKGKERKAKQLAKKEESVSTAHEFWRGFCSTGTTSECNHGCGVIKSDDHPVSSFMDQFFINVKKQGVEQNLREIFKSHGHIWNNKSYRKLAIDILVCMGTNMVLRGKSSWSVYLAQSIVPLEHYNGTDDIDSIFDSREVISKWRDLNLRASSIKRDLLKIFRNRTSCKCLKKMHLEVRKSTPKMGICYYCVIERGRDSLSVCSQCMVQQYCSRECQVADWSKHKSRCDILVRAHLIGIAG